MINNEYKQLELFIEVPLEELPRIIEPLEASEWENENTVEEYDISKMFKVPS